MAIRILFSLFEGIWRRMFGCDIISRAVLHIINATTTTLFLWYMNISWIKIAVVVPLFEFWYWSVGHGAAFDIGRDYPPTEEIIKRYKKYFWNKWCEFLVPKQFWYGFGYDYLWMCFRYGFPALLISLILGNLSFGYCGFYIPTIYAIFWSFYDKGKIKKPTEWSEVFVGLISGLLLV